MDKNRKDKRGLSIVIGYILLITISIVMSIIVYQWLKTYVPTESLKCSEGTSIFIKDISYDCTSSKLDITVNNNGKFSIDGYFIHVSNKSDEELATIDLSSKIISGGSIFGNSIKFSDLVDNSLAPAGERPSSFNVAEYCPCDVGKKLVKVEIIPIRIQEIKNKNWTVSCSDAKVEEALTCS